MTPAIGEQTVRSIREGLIALFSCPKEEECLSRTSFVVMPRSWTLACGGSAVLDTVRQSQDRQTIPRAKSRFFIRSIAVVKLTVDESRELVVGSSF